MKEGWEKVAQSFAKPPAGYGIVPFYWWLGDRLTKERMEWQLKKMRGHAVSGLQINYAHGYEGGRSFGLTLKSDPPLFSDKWWELFEWLLKKGKKEGFSVSLSDYTLGTPGQGWYTDEILAAHPEMAGSLLREKHAKIKDGKAVLGSIPENVLSVHILEKGCMKRLDERTIQEEMHFSGEQEGIVSVVYAERQPYSLNPMHPLSGEMVCEYFFDRFEQHAPGEGGKGLNFFFSDELNFGISGKLWDDLFEEEFFRQKHYDIRDYLPCLFWEMPEYFAKVRLDYSDVLVSREENSYFKVVYDWHESRGMTYGCDHGGRGYDVTEFGDYFRTQKYNQGPGCDQPNLSSDIVKNKVASSIAHLYGRKRVWLEGFYGSGWGTTSGAFMDAVVRNFVMGHNLLSVHGMYYSTHGGWWEWAPPCNTWHMPYWDDMVEAFQAIERMSYLLSQGTHCCDVAVLYPVMAAEGGVEAQKSVDMAFECVRRLYEDGLDVDFIDYHSILVAEIRNDRLEKEGESYQIIILPEIKTVRLDMMKKLQRFVRLGGIVLGMGDLPVYSDSWKPQELQEDLEGLRFGFRIEDVMETVKEIIKADVIFPDDAEQNRKYMLHRRIEGVDFYMVYGGERGSGYGFHSIGKAVFWNPYDGKRYRLVSQEKGEYSFIHLPLSGKELQMISFSESVQEPLPVWPGDRPAVLRTVTELSDEWSFRLEPCLDNRFGDYILSVSDEKLGAQVRELYGLRTEEKEPYPEKLDILIKENLVKRYGTINFTGICQPLIREELKSGIYLNLQCESIATVQKEMTAMRRLSSYLKEQYPDLQSLKNFNRTVLEEYLTYLKTEKMTIRQLHTELNRLRVILECIGKVYNYGQMEGLLLTRDIPPVRKTEFKDYSDAELKRLHAHIVKLNEQYARAMIIHQLLGTRISDTLTLETDCLHEKNDRTIIRIRQMKTKPYEKPISSEVAALIRKAIQYTRERYGEKNTFL